MKTKYLLLIIFLLSSNFIFAQKSEFNSLIDKYEKEDDVTIITVSKAMFNLIGGKINTGNNVDLTNIVPKIESLRLITSESSKLQKQMEAEFKSLINKDKTYEELMRIKDGKTNITFNFKKSKGVNELIMFISEEDGFVAIQILGSFTVEDIQKMTN